MDKNTIKKLLKVSLWKTEIHCKEYQDKFYLYKEIQEILPEIPEDRIYGAIDEVNKIFKSPVTNRRFIEAFSDKLKI